MVDEVAAAIGVHTTHLGFTRGTDQSPAFTDVQQGSCGWTGSSSSPTNRRAGRAAARYGGRVPQRPHHGTGRSQRLLEDPAGEPIEPFEPRG